MNDNKKQPYLAPAVKVVEYKVERGFQSTFQAPGTAGATNGTEQYTMESTTAEGWF